MKIKQEKYRFTRKCTYMLQVGVSAGESREAGAVPPPLEHRCDHHLDSKQHPQEKGICRDVLPCPTPPEPPEQPLRSTES